MNPFISFPQDLPRTAEKHSPSRAGILNLFDLWVQFFWFKYSHYHDTEPGPIYILAIYWLTKLTWLLFYIKI